MPSRSRPVRVTDLVSMKRRGEKISVLTAYDATMARLLDGAGIDVLLVGDSLGMVVMGYETTVPVTLDMMVHHAAAVSRGTARALVVADMPFLTYKIDPSETLRNAGRLVQEGGVAAVKLEGGRATLEATSRLVGAGIPVMGHLGLMPQSVHQTGGFRTQGEGPGEGDRLIEDALALESAGAFAIVLEKIPEALASRVTASVAIPTIGIGAGPDCDGQVLVSYDMLGLFQEFVPSFVKQYAKLGEQVAEAARSFRDEVRAGEFPPAAEGAVPQKTGGMRE